MRITSQEWVAALEWETWKTWKMLPSRLRRHLFNHTRPDRAERRESRRKVCSGSPGGSPVLRRSGASAIRGLAQTAASNGPPATTPRTSSSWHGHRAETHQRLVACLSLGPISSSCCSSYCCRRTQYLTSCNLQEAEVTVVCCKVVYILAARRFIYAAPRGLLAPASAPWVLARQALCSALRVAPWTWIAAVSASSPFGA